MIIFPFTNSTSILFGSESTSEVSMLTKMLPNFNFIDECSSTPVLPIFWDISKIFGLIEPPWFKQEIISVIMETG